MRIQTAQTAVETNYHVFHFLLEKPSLKLEQSLFFSCGHVSYAPSNEFSLFTFLPQRPAGTGKEAY